MFWVCLVALTVPEGMKNNTNAYTNIFLDNDQGIDKLNMIFHLNKDMHLCWYFYLNETGPVFSSVMTSTAMSQEAGFVLCAFTYCYPFSILLFSLSLI